MGEMPAGRVAKELISVLGTVAAVSTGAYLVTRSRPPVSLEQSAGRIRELERRLAALEQTGAAALSASTAPSPAIAAASARDLPVPPPELAVQTPTTAFTSSVPTAPPVVTSLSLVVPVGPAGPLHKPFTVTHYENLASQVAHERQIAELERRLAAIEASRGSGPLLSGAPRRNIGTPNRTGTASHRERRHG
jgi:hypothetical protein